MELQRLGDELQVRNTEKDEKARTNKAVGKEREDLREVRSEMEMITTECVYRNAHVCEALCKKWVTSLHIMGTTSGKRKKHPWREIEKTKARSNVLNRAVVLPISRIRVILPVARSRMSPQVGQHGKRDPIK